MPRGVHEARAAAGGGLRGSGRPLRFSAALLIVGYLFLATFPGWYAPISPGLDPSWAYGINVLPHTDFVFGPDVIFTFGPLGYLVSPLDVGSNLVQAGGLWILSQIILVGTALYHFLRTKRLGALAAFAVAYVVASSFGIPLDYRLLLNLGLLLSVSPRDGSPWRILAALAGVLGGFLLFTKAGAALGGLLMLAIASVLWVLRRDARLGAVLLTPWAPFALTVVTVGITLMDGIPNLITWLVLMTESARGYSVSMSMEAPTALVILGILASLTYVIVVAVLGRVDGWMYVVGALFAGGAFSAFKHSFVRHGGRFLFAFLLGALAIVLLTASTKRLVMVGGAAFALLLPFAALASVQSGCICPWRPDLLAPGRGWENVRTLISLGDARRDLVAQSQELLAPLRLPPAWLNQMRDGTVDVLPWELSMIEANALRWTPNPVLQTYTAFTARLDQRTARHFQSNEAPDHLLVQFADVDGRHPMWGAPLMWRSILSHYEPAPVAQEDWVALLRRRATPMPLRLTTIGRGEHRVGEWITIPSDGGLTFGRILVQENLAGRLAELLIHVKPLHLDLRFQDGSTATMRLLPLTASGGVLLTPLPESLEDFLGLYGGVPGRRAVALRLHGPGVRSYHPELQIVWEAATWPPSSSEVGSPR